VIIAPGDYPLPVPPWNDSLSRLLTANNPESGQISYVYDDDNLLMTT